MTKHHISWNAADERWFCIRCLRTSNHDQRQDAEVELSEFDCVPPKDPQRKAANVSTVLKLPLAIQLPWISDSAPLKSRQSETVVPVGLEI